MITEPEPTKAPIPTVPVMPMPGRASINRIPHQMNQVHTSQLWAVERRIEAFVVTRIVRLLIPVTLIRHSQYSKVALVIE